MGVKEAYKTIKEAKEMADMTMKRPQTVEQRIVQDARSHALDFVLDTLSEECPEVKEEESKC